MRHGSRKERLEALTQSVSRQHSGHYEAGHSAFRASRRHNTLYLRGNTRRPEGVPRERYPRRGDVHGAREAQNGHIYKRRVRAETFRS